MILAFGYCAAAIILAALAPSTARAQATPPQAPAAQAQTTPPQEPAAAPATPPHTLSGSATIGVSLETGRTDLTGVQVQLEAKRPYSTTGSFDGSFSYAYATASPPGHAPRATVADRLTAAFDVEQNFGKRLVMMLRAQVLRDPVAQIQYRIGEMAGLGVRFGDERVHVRVVPGVAFLNDEMHLPDDGFRVHYGLYEDITATITPAWAFAHYLSISRGISDPHDYIIALDAKLTGTVTRRFAIQLAYQYNYEKRLPPGVEPQYQKTTAGLQIRF